jgi:hypothetical protein
MTTPRSPATRELARRLLESETAGVTDLEQLGAGLERVGARVAANLRGSLGEDGYSALLARAFVRAQSEQPMLNDIRRNNGGGVDLDVLAGVQDHGAAAVAAGLECLLAALVDVLSELIGVDMVRALLDYDDSPPTPGERRPQ